MNAATQALSAALFLVDGAAVKPERLAVADPAAEFPTVDGPLAGLTGEELDTLGQAAEVLALRADALRRGREREYSKGEIAKLKNRKV
jgi:hypothetical protein